MVIKKCIRLWNRIYNLFRGASVVDGNDLRYSTARAISGGIGGLKKNEIYE
jgi:hypothetical protein